MSNQISFTVGNSISYAAYGFAFWPYLPGQDPTTGIVITPDQIRNRLAAVAPYMGSTITYSSTGGEENTAMIASEFGLQTGVGISLGPDDVANQKEISGAIGVFQGGFGKFLIVGNEVLLRKDLTEKQLLAYIAQVHKAVPQAIITTAETYAVLLQHPNIVAACDFILVHYYPYWDGKDVSHAIAALDGNDKMLRTAYPHKEIIIGETGWPSSGGNNGSAVASPKNAAYYFLNFVSWARASNRKYFYFEVFDEGWLIYQGPQGPYWGVWDQDGTMKPGMLDVFSGKTIPNNWSNGGVTNPPPPPDTIPPTAPTNLSATAASANEIDLAWTASTDNVAVTNYHVYRDGVPIATTNGTIYRDTMLQSSTTYAYQVTAYDAAGNASPASSTASATTFVGSITDLTPPSVPTDLVATVVSSTQINLSWATSTDNVGVVGYDVYRNGSYIATTTATSYQDTNLQAGVQDSYTVDAFDAALNTSAESAPASATPVCSTLPGGQGTPSVQFLSVPAIGTFGNLTGQVLHVAPANYYVAVFIHVYGVWWTKPYYDEPTTPINCDGSWTADITTGGDDEDADTIAAYVLPMSFSVPLAEGNSGSVPDGVTQNAVASVSASR